MVQINLSVAFFLAALTHVQVFALPVNLDGEL